MKRKLKEYLDVSLKTSLAESLNDYFEQTVSGFNPDNPYIKFKRANNILLPNNIGSLKITDYKELPPILKPHFPHAMKEQYNFDKISKDINYHYLNILFGCVLSKDNLKFANVINTIKYIFYHNTKNKKIFLTDHLRIRDNSIQAKEYSLLTILGLNTNYNLLFNIINNKIKGDPTQEETINKELEKFIKENLFLDLFINFKNSEILSKFSLNNLLKDDDILNIYFKERKDYETEFVEEIKNLIDELVDLIKNIGIVNGNILLIALLKFMIFNSNCNIYTFDLANNDNGLKIKDPIRNGIRFVGEYMEFVEIKQKLFKKN